MTVRVAHALGGEREDAQGQGYREYVAHHQNLFALLYTRPPTHLATRECTIAWLGRPAGPAVGRATAAAALARAGGGGAPVWPDATAPSTAATSFQITVFSCGSSRTGITRMRQQGQADRHPGSVLARRAFARVIAMTSFEFGEWFAFGATACVVVRTLVAGEWPSHAESVEWRQVS
jgi:hypothetical protein